MRARDFTDGCTWVLGVTAADNVVLYVKRSSRRWTWSSNPLAAETFRTRELAQACLDSAAGLADMVNATMPKSETHRLRPVKITLQTTVVEE